MRQLARNADCDENLELILHKVQMLKRILP